MSLPSVGIDPGKKGAWVYLAVDKILWGRDLPSIVAADLAVDCMSARMTLEQVSASPQMGVSSAFSFGVEFGKWLSAVESVFDHELVKPQVWQHWLVKNDDRYREMLASVHGPERKRALKAIAQELFPNIKVIADNADALLIALYGSGRKCEPILLEAKEVQA
jgi:hypothetical protein